MKRSLLIAAAAATAVALLTGCSATTSTSLEESAAPKPGASSSSGTNSQNPTKPEPPKGSDASLIAFTDAAVASCEKVTAEGGVAKADGFVMITVPEAKAVDKVADVGIATSPDGKTVGNYIIAPEPRTGRPMPLVCSVSGNAYTDLMKDGKSTRFTGSGDSWTWTEEQVKFLITLKDGMIDTLAQISKVDGKEIKTSYTVTYGLTDADVKAFTDAVKNPTEPGSSNK